MKKYLTLLLPLLITLATYARPVVDDHVINSFKIFFPEAENIRWHETGNSYIVHFMDQGIRSRAVFDKLHKGIILTRYYTDDHLPTTIRIKLRKDHPFKKVTGVTEISGYSSKGKPLYTEYYINLEDTYRLINVKIKRNGKHAVVGRFVKART